MSGAVTTVTGPTAKGALSAVKAQADGGASFAPALKLARDLLDGTITRPGAGSRATPGPTPPVGLATVGSSAEPAQTPATTPELKPTVIAPAAPSTSADVTASEATAAALPQTPSAFLAASFSGGRIEASSADVPTETNPADAASPVGVDDSALNAAGSASVLGNPASGATEAAQRTVLQPNPDQPHPAQPEAAQQTVLQPNPDQPHLTDAPVVSAVAAATSATHPSTVAAVLPPATRATAGGAAVPAVTTSSGASLSTPTGSAAAPPVAAPGHQAGPVGSAQPSAARSSGADGEKLASMEAQPDQAAGNPAAQPVTVQPTPPSQTATPATPALPAPAAQPVPLATQLYKPVFSLTAAAPGEHLITVRVAPDEFGPVTVRAVVTAEGMRVELFAPTDAAREALRGILPELRRDLAAPGMTSSLDVSTKDPADDGGPAAGEPDGQDAARRDRSTALPAPPATSSDSAPPDDLPPGRGGPAWTRSTLDLLA
ncbi:flagellar hook-length control protein FliK [Arthrobacter sp. H20]|uniref:flagellar hook-length control protein FliK n=1 Tax=Arthrobacter sp. H20 TaxID=1267981 RepID=UPI00047ACCC2|nr:flagellar hook-length control protein FliK [Arthrobacter sp. H20]